MKKLLGIVVLGLILLAGCSGGYDKEDETVLEKCADLSFKQMIQFLSKLQDTQGAYSQEGEGELKKIEQGKQWTAEKEQLIGNIETAVGEIQSEVDTVNTKIEITSGSNIEKN